MREIKFRAWDMGLKEIIYFDLKSANDTVDCLVYEDIMQYTGLKDKNGKEIYEGDIVKYREYPSNEKSELCKIEWLDSYEGDGFKMTGFVSPAYGYPSDIEIIGNIHENPELVKK